MLMKTSLSAHHVSLKLDFRSDCEIKTHSHELSQVLLQLIQNANDALISKEKQERWISIVLEHKKDSCLISIEDSAGGIDEAILDQIFDPYFSTKKEKNGVGLGLFIAQTIVYHHLDGSIKVSNTENGAKFEILFPTKEFHANSCSA